MKNFQAFINYIGNTRAKQRRNIMITAILAVLVLFVVSMLMTKPADSMSGKLICGKQLHIHSSECMELVCDIQEHVCNESCLATECTEVHVCDESCPVAECPFAHVCDENCPPDYCELAHECDEFCVIPECTEVHVCDEECVLPSCTPHQHTAECYQYVCNIDEHEHSQECYETVQTEMFSAFYNNDIQLMADEQATEATEPPPAEAFMTKPDTLIDLSNAINIKNFLINETANDRTTKLVSQDSQSELIADATFRISFRLTQTNNVNEFNMLKDNVNQLLYYELPEAVTFDPEKYNADCKVKDQGMTAAYYTLVNYNGKGYAIFRMTEEYRENYLNKEGQNADTFTCSLTFKADVQRDSTDTGDRTVYLGNNNQYEAKIQFPDYEPSIDKSGNFVNNEDGNPRIDWTITIKNPTYGTNFYGYLLTDDMFDEMTDGTLSVSPAGAFVEVKDAEGKITALQMNIQNLTRDNYPITVKYSVPAKEYVFEQPGDHHVYNKAVLQKDGVEKKYEKEGSAWVNSAAQIQKSVSPDYKRRDADNKPVGTIANELDWTIQVDTKFGLPIGGYGVKDDAFISDTKDSAKNIKVFDGTTELTKDTHYTINEATGTIKFAKGLTQKSLTITYTTANAVPIAAAYNEDVYVSNTATVKYPNGKDGSSSTASYAYKPYTIYKTGEYDHDTGLIKWNVTFKIMDFASPTPYTIDDIIFTDERLAQLADVNNDGEIDQKDIKVNGASSIDDTNETTSNIEYVWDKNTPNKITFSTDTEGSGSYNINDWGKGPATGASLEFYTTPIGDENDVNTELGSINAGQKTVMLNTASIAFKDTVYTISDEATATYDPQNSLDKSMTYTENKSISLDDTDKVTKLDWTVNVRMDRGFAQTDELLVDTMRAVNSDGTENTEAKHYIDPNDRDEIIVRGRSKTSDQWSEPLTEGTDYEILFYADDISQSAAADDAKAKKFTIKFLEPIDTKKYRFVQIDYVSTADVSDVESASKITFKNKAELDEMEKDAGSFTYDVYDADTRAFDKTAINVETGNEVSGDDAVFDVRSLTTRTVDGVKYYIFGWKVDFYQSDNLVAIHKDIIPVKHKLCTANDFSGSYKPLIYELNWDNKYVSYDLTPVSDVNSMYNYKNYYYDSQNSTVYFKINHQYAKYMIYYTMVPASELDTELFMQIEEGSTDGVTYSNLFEPNDQVNKNKYGTSSAGVTVTGEPDIPPVDMGNVIEKHYIPQKESNYDSATGTEYKIEESKISYYIDINPEAKDLAVGDSLILNDLFEAVSYKEQNKNPVYGMGAANAILKEIKVYEVDGESLTELPSAEYSYQYYDGASIPQKVDLGRTDVDEHNINLPGLKPGDIVTITFKGQSGSTLNGKSTLKSTGGWVNDHIHYANLNSDGIHQVVISIPIDDSAKGSFSYYYPYNDVEVSFEAYRTLSTSKLELTIPDSKHLRIEYTYDILVDGGTLKNKSEFSFKNTATLIGSGVKEAKSANSVDVDYGDADASVTYLPTIHKVDISDHTLKGLEAKFKFAKYNPTSKQWQWYSEVLANQQQIDPTKWVDGTTTETVAVSTVNGVFELKGLESGALYALVEVDKPDDVNGYTYQEVEYIQPFYFSYGTTITSFPTGVNAEQLSLSNVKTIQINSVINVPNNRMIDVSVLKEWDDPQINPTVNVALYWSYKKVLSGFPDEMHLANGTELKTTNIQNPVDISEVHTWENLPNGLNGKPIYYYVKELSYNINNSGAVQVGSGEYVPLYSGNGVNVSGSPIKITNAGALQIKKYWCDVNNIPLPDSFIPVNEIDIELYGRKTPVGDYTLIDTFTITKENDWRLKFTTDQLGDYQYFKVKEVDTPEGFSVSVLENYEGQTGSFTVTNKSDKELPYTSIKVQKKWQDEGYSGRPENIILTLLTSTDQQSWEEVDMPQPDKVILDNNNWTYTYEKLFYQDASGNPIYYKVKEAEINGYTLTELNNNGVSTTTDENPIILVNTKTLSIDMVKKWNDDGRQDDHSGDKISVTIYRATNESAFDNLSSCEKVRENIEISANNSWKAKAEDLPAYDENGNVYYYRVVENLGELDGAYDPSYVYNDNGSTYISLNDGTVVINNTYIYKPVELPMTGSGGKTIYYVMGMAAIIIGCAIYISAYIKNEKQRKKR